MEDKNIEEMLNAYPDMKRLYKKSQQIKINREKRNRQFNLLMHEYMNTKYNNLNFTDFCNIINKSRCASMIIGHYDDIDDEVEIYMFKCRMYDLYLKYGIDYNEHVKCETEDEAIASLSFHSLCSYIRYMKEEGWMDPNVTI